MSENERELAPYLPSAQKIEEMSLNTFGDWVDKALHDLPERKVKRDPLFHLKKEISQILKEQHKSEAAKEEKVLSLIKTYFKNFAS
ncbi:hypothetical protein LC040_05905 [Bacillus tianshenii]|nr:hypothetical protein LC040_05905 [Bacillus tianshenii]